MKKPILLTILACCLLFFGFEKANASAFKVTLTSLTTAAGTDGLVSPATIPGTATNYAVMGFYLTGSGSTAGSGTFTTLSFFNYGNSNDANNLYYTTAYLYSSTTNNFSTGTLVQLASVTSDNTQEITFNTNIAVSNSTAPPVYYFLVFSNTLGDTNNQNSQWGFYDDTYVKTTGANGDPMAQAAVYYGPSYKFAAAPAVTATATSLTTTAGMSGTSSPATISTTGTYTIYGMSITPSATGTSKTITGLSFTTSSANGNSYFYGTAYLFAGTATGPTGAAIATINPTTASTTLSFTGFTSTLTAGAANTLYYYVEIVYSSPGVAATTSTTLSYSGYTSTATISPSGGVAGPAYTFQTLPVVTGTATSLTTTPGSNGLYNNSGNISAPGTYAIYGMSITPSATGISKTITGLSFTTSSTNGNSYFYGTAYLFSGTATGPTGAAIATINPTTASQTLNFTGFTSTLTSTGSGGATLYYYVEIVYSVPGVAATTSTTLSYSGYTSGATITASGGVAGPIYTFNPIPYVTATIASLTTLNDGTDNLLIDPIASTETGAIYGLSVTPSTTGVTAALTGLTFTNVSAQYNNYFYATATLYSSANSSYDGTAVSISTVTTTASNTLTFGSFTTAQTLVAGAATKYYYVVISYTGANVTGTVSSQLNLTSATTTATPSYGSLTGPTYNYSALTVTAASVGTPGGTNGLTANPINMVLVKQPIYELSLTASGSGPSKTITGLSFTATSTQNNNYFYANAYLYESTSATFDGTAVQVSTVATGANKVLTFTGFSNTLTAATPLYYYILISYPAPGVATAMQTLALTTVTGTIYTGAATGNTYTFSPTPAITGNNIAAANLTAGAVYVGQQNIGLAGESFTTNQGTGTLSKIVFTYAPTSAPTPASYYSAASIELVSSNTPPSGAFNYASATHVATNAATFAAGTITLTLTTPATVTTTPTYYYLVADYTVTGGATPKTYTFTPSSYTSTVSATTTTTNTSYTANSFTCTTPTYYWTGNAGDNNWTTANNWEVTTTAPIIVNGYYPGQIYAGNTASTQDNADVSPSVASPTINLASNITIANIQFEKAVSTTLNINGAAIKLNISNELDLGSTTSGSAASTLTLGGTGILDINADAELNYSSNLIVPSGANFTIDNNADVNLNGGTAQIAKISLTGGTITSNGGNFELDGNAALINGTSGIFNALLNTYIDLNAGNDQVTNNGATFNIDDSNDFSVDATSANVTNNSGTLNIINTNFILTPGSFTVTGGTVNITNDAGGGSLLQLGGINVNVINFNITLGNGTVSVTGGTVNVSGASEVHMDYNTPSTFTNNGGAVNFTGNSLLFADDAAYINTSGTTTVNASTVELAVGGVSLTNAGTFNMSAASILEFTTANSTMTNTGTFNTASTTVNFNANTCTLNNTAGSFNFGTSSIMNLAANTDKLNNSGTGIFTCSPLSVINLSGGTSAGNAPTVNNTGLFTLLSDATGSATIGKITYPITTGSVTGVFNVQRYISVASRNYRALSSAVNKTSATPGTTTAPDVVDISALGRTVTSPATYPGAFIGGPGAGFPNYVANPLLYLYQESILPGTTENSSFTSGKNVGIINITNATPWTVSTQSTAAGGQTASDNSTSVKIPAGNGYLLYYIHDNTSSVVTDPLNSCATTATGYINQGQIPLVLWGTSPYSSSLTLTTGTGALYPGVTMVGNPYPSSIDLNAVFNDNIGSGQIYTNGTGSAFYELDPTTEQFVSYNYSGSGTGTTSGSTASRYVASGQGFYVTVVKANKQLYFNEDQKIPSTSVAAVTNVPGTVLESVNGGGPVHTIDNVLPGNKSADAILPVRNINTKVYTSVSDMEAAISQSPKLIGRGSLHLNTVIDSSKLPIDTLKEKHKKYITTLPGDTTKTPPPPPSTLAGLHLKLVMDSLTFDECGIYFKNGWSDKLDNNDARDLDGTGGKVYLSSYSSDDVRTSINAMSNYTGGKRVKLFVKFNAAGIFKLQMPDIANFNTGSYSVFLIDNMLKDSLDLTLYKSYNFNYAPGTANDSTRFVLVIEHKPVPHYALLTFAGQKVTQGVQLNWTVKNEANTIKFVVQKLGATNTYAFLDSLQSDSASDYNFVDQHPSLGNNTYRLQQTDALGNITYSAPVTIGYNSTSPNGGLNIYPNPARSAITVTLSTSSLATQVSTVDIYNTSGILIEHKVVNSNSFTHDVSSYQLGVYIIELKNSNGLLVGKSKFVKVQ